MYLLSTRGLIDKIHTLFLSTYKMLRKQIYQWTKYCWHDACCESIENSIRVRKCRKASTNKNVDDDNCYNSDANFKWITKRKCIFQRKNKMLQRMYVVYVMKRTETNHVFKHSNLISIPFHISNIHFQYSLFSLLSFFSILFVSLTIYIIILETKLRIFKWIF